MLLERWPHIDKVVNSCEKLPKPNQLKCKKFKIVAKAVDDCWIPLKINLSDYFSSLFRPFLVKYQHKKPLILICTKILRKWSSNLLKLLYKAAFWIMFLALNSTSSIWKKTFTLVCKRFFSAWFKKAGFSWLNSFYTNVLLSVETTFKKLRKIYTLSSVVIRNSIVFNPSVMVPSSQDVHTKKLKALVHHLTSLKIIPAYVGDKVIINMASF